MHVYMLQIKVCLYMCMHIIGTSHDMHNIRAGFPIKRVIYRALGVKLLLINVFLTVRQQLFIT